MDNLLNEEYFDLNNWTKNMDSFPVFQNTYTDGANILNYQGGGDYERIYIPITIEQNRNYQFKFCLYSPTGFTMGDYGNDYAFAFIRTSVPSDTWEAFAPEHAAETIAYSEAWDDSAADEPKQYNISFHSGNYTTLYVALDFGYILDGVTVQFVFSDFSLCVCSEDTVGISCMPVMADVNACFDARVGVGENEWKNLTGDIHFQLFHPIKNADGVEVVGSEASYGKLTKPWTSGSSRTWYFIFKNLSGVYTDWRTIIGNEADTYKCSTLAMDANGYIKFTRPNIVPSTSLGFQCSDWHVVAWVSDASTGRTKLWIDGTYIGYVSNMQGWADDTYLARGSSWWYTDNNTVFRAIAIADSAHADDEVVSNSNWLYQAYISEYVAKLYETRYLLRSEGVFYTVTDETLAVLEVTELTAQAFQTYGFEDVPEWSVISGLVNPEILYWQDNTDDAPELTATMTATPKPQTLFAAPFYMTDATILGIDSVTCTYEGSPLIALSFDSGAFEYYDGSSWVTASDTEGMPPDVLTAITADVWEAKVAGVESVQTRVILNTNSDTLHTIKFNFINEE